MLNVFLFRCLRPLFFSLLTLALTYGPPMQHRTTQSYQNVAPLHHVPQQSQSRTLSGSQSTQQPYPSPNIYTPQPSLQSPFLTSQAQFQAQQAPAETPNFYPPTQSPRSQHSGAGTYYSTGKLVAKESSPQLS